MRGNNVPFSFHQTGAHFIKDGRLYNIERKFQKAQARKAGIDFRIGGNDISETASFREPCDLQLRLESIPADDGENSI